jgi:hypothetical protein
MATPRISKAHIISTRTPDVLLVQLSRWPVLPYTRGDDHVRRTIADKLIALVKTGERNPDVLCEQALEEICRPPIGESPRAM